MTTYRRKDAGPTQTAPTIEAIQLTYFNADKVEDFVGGDIGNGPEGAVFATLEGALPVRVHDFVIRDAEGKFSACSPRLFAETYEQVPA